MKVLEGLFERIRDGKDPRISKLALLLVTSAILSGILTSLLWNLEQPVSYAPGEIARQTVRAPHDLIVEDALTTEKRRAEALAKVKPIFSANPDRQAEPSKHLNYLFSALRELSGGATQKDGNLVLSQESRSEIERRFHLDFVGPEWEVIANPTAWPKLEAATVEITKPIVAKGIIQDKKSIQGALAKNQILIRESNGAAEETLVSANSVIDMSDALARADAAFPAKGFGKGAAFDSLVRKLIYVTLRPNVLYDGDETDRRVKQARDTVDASVLRVLRGQVLVREGDLVTPSQQALVAQFQSEKRPISLVQVFVGHFVLTMTLMLSVYFFALNFWPGFRLKTGDLVLLSIILCSSFLILKAFSFVGTALSYTFPYLDADTILLAAPLAAGGILLQATLGGAAVFGYTILVATLTGVFLEDSWLLMVLTICGNFVGATTLRTCSRRSTYIYAGVRVAGVMILLTSCFLMLYPEVSTEGNLAMIVFAGIGGIASGILAGAFAPFAEFIGGYITDIQLLELASLDRPLLRELSLQAPGTWNHSMVMGQIAEAAAESIGANPLLARVGAFYHDIGKVSKPAYFVENQARENRHDKLTPSMSALIIKSHVKEGMEMAMEHRLPKALIDFIPQHHGNSLIEYFYEKALREAEPDEVVDQSHYRYPGPRPQTKEAGILMLSDAVEASSRTLSDPTPAKIQGLVQKIINKVFSSGELDECSLTLRELHLIAKSFTRVLTGIYHRRIEYNEPAEKKCDGSRSAKAKKDESAEKPKKKEEHHEKRPNEERADFRTPEVVGRDKSETEGGKLPEDTISADGDSQKRAEPLKRLGMH